MKRYFLLCGCLLAMFASSCSDELAEQGINVSAPERQAGLGKILITLPADVSTRSNDEATHDNLHGTADVNAGRILIFESDKKDPASEVEYKCIKDTTITFSIVEWDKENVNFASSDDASDFNDDKYGHNSRYTGYGYFQPKAGKFYRIYAYAYHKDGVEPTVSSGTPDDGDDATVIIDGKLLQNGATRFTAEQLASISVEQATPKNEGKTMEIYGGFLLAYKSAPYPYKDAVYDDKNYIIGDHTEQIVNYGGELKRRTGRLEIILTDMAENDVTSASMVIEKYAKEEPVGMEVTTIKIDESTYKSTYYNPFDKETMTVTAAKTPDENGEIHLSADMFYIEDSYVYIDVTYADGDTKRFQTRCKDSGEIPAGPDGIVTQISKNSKITLLPNCWATLKGSYEQLVKGGNLSLEENWGENYDGGILDEEITTN